MINKMENNITIITNSNRDIKIEGYKYPVCIYNKTLPSYQIENCKFIELKDLTNYLSTYQDQIDLFIVSNLGRMITPANRCEQIWEHIYSGIKCQKLAIENQIYYLQEWRMWFIYGFLDTRIFGFGTSFEAERQWENKNIDLLQHIKPYTKCLIKNQFEFDINLEIYKTSEKEKTEYEKVKKELFDNSNNIRQVLLGLIKYMKSIYPKHNLSLDLSFLYNISNQSNNLMFEENNILNLFLTDLKCDQYLLSQLQNLITNSNKLTGQLYENLSN